MRSSVLRAAATCRCRWSDKDWTNTLTLYTHMLVQCGHTSIQSHCDAYIGSSMCMCVWGLLFAPITHSHPISTFCITFIVDGVFFVVLLLLLFSFFLFEQKQPVSIDCLFVHRTYFPSFFHLSLSFFLLGCCCCFSCSEYVPDFMGRNQRVALRRLRKHKMWNKINLCSCSKMCLLFIFNVHFHFRTNSFAVQWPSYCKRSAQQKNCWFFCLTQNKMMKRISHPRPWGAASRCEKFILIRSEIASQSERPIHKR